MLISGTSSSFHGKARRLVLVKDLARANRIRCARRRLSGESFSFSPLKRCGPFDHYSVNQRPLFTESNDRPFDERTHKGLVCVPPRNVVLAGSSRERG
jgi:hypothetical protein